MKREPLWRVVRGVMDDFFYKNPDWDIERLSEKLQCAPNTLRKYAEPPAENNGSGRVIPANRLMDLGELARDDRVAHWVISRFKDCDLLRDVTVGDARPNYENATVEGIDFSGQDLRGVSFKGAKLFHVNMSACRLETADFSGAYFLNGCNLYRAKMASANLSGAFVDEATFEQADIGYSTWRNARIQRSSFKDTTHTGADMRDVSFSDVDWFADRYRGGLSLGASQIGGLKGVSESHAVVRQIILNVANGRHRFNALAGFVDLKLLGCWQTILDFMFREFSDLERSEIFGALKEHPEWLIDIRLDFEMWKRERLLAIWGEDWSRWPIRSRLRDEPLVGEKVEIRGVSGVVSKVGLFKPDGVEGERFDTMDCMTDEMLIQGMAKRRTA